MEAFSSLLAMSDRTLLASLAKSRSLTSCGDTGTTANASRSSLIEAHPTYNKILTVDAWTLCSIFQFFFFFWSLQTHETGLLYSYHSWCSIIWTNSMVLKTSEHFTLIACYAWLVTVRLTFFLIGLSSSLSIDIPVECTQVFVQRWWRRT